MINVIKNNITTIGIYLFKITSLVWIPIPQTAFICPPKNIPHTKMIQEGPALRISGFLLIESSNLWNKRIIIDA